MSLHNSLCAALLGARDKRKKRSDQRKGVEKRGETEPVSFQRILCSLRPIVRDWQANGQWEDAVLNGESMDRTQFERAVLCLACGRVLQKLPSELLCSSDATQESETAVLVTFLRHLLRTGGAVRSLHNISTV